MNRCTLTYNYGNMFSICRYFHDCLISDNFLEVYNFDGVTFPQLSLVVSYMYRQISWKQLTGLPFRPLFLITL